ncbi:MAG: thioredoxin family protein, partial [Ginsengibacter sp.]
YGLPFLSVTRLFFAISTIAFTIYMIPGLWGAPLNGISGWLPENKTQDFNIEKLIRNSAQQNTNTASLSPGKQIKPKKYIGLLQSEIPGVETFFDYEEGLAAAKELKKPIMIDFTGHSCANCRKMESQVLSKPEVSSILQNDFIVISLYVDEKKELPENEKYTSAFDQSSIKTIGAKNLDIEATLANSNAQPLYLFLDEKGKLIKDGGGFEPGIPRFISMLSEVKAENRKRNP